MCAMPRSPPHAHIRHLPLLQSFTSHCLQVQSCFTIPIRFHFVHFAVFPITFPFRFRLLISSITSLTAFGISRSTPKCHLRCSCHLWITVSFDWTICDAPKQGESIKHKLVRGDKQTRTLGIRQIHGVCIIPEAANGESFIYIIGIIKVEHPRLLLTVKLMCHLPS